MASISDSLYAQIAVTWLQAPKKGKAKAAAPVTAQAAALLPSPLTVPRPFVQTPGPALLQSTPVAVTRPGNSASAAADRTLGAVIVDDGELIVKQAAVAEQVKSDFSMAQGSAHTTAIAAPRPATAHGAVRSTSGKPSERESAALQPDVTKLSSAALQGVRPTSRQAAQTEHSAVEPDSIAATPSATMGATAGPHGEVQHTAQQSAVSVRPLALRSEVNSSLLAAVTINSAAVVSASPVVVVPGAASLSPDAADPAELAAKKREQPVPTSVPSKTTNVELPSTTSAAADPSVQVCSVAKCLPSMCAVTSSTACLEQVSWHLYSPLSHLQILLSFDA